MVQTGFILLTFLVIGFITYLLGKTDKKHLLQFFIGLGLWIIYLYGLLSTGILTDFGLPPRMPLLVILPILTLFIVWSRSKKFQFVLSNNLLFIPILFQSFRILVELMIHDGYVQGVFPKSVTFEGINFDILVGISALIVAPLVRNGRIGNRGILAWNIVSLAVLMVTVYSFLSYFYFNSSVPDSEKEVFLQFPIVLLPSFLLPTAVFLHIFSIKQVMSYRRKIAIGVKIPEAKVE